MRVNIQQPALPNYRHALFKQLSKQVDIDLCVYYSSVDHTLPNVVTNDYKSKYYPIHRFHIFKKYYFLWHSPQWFCSSKVVSDVVILSWDLHYLSLLPSILRARFNRIPVILWGHGFSKNDNWFKSNIRRWVSKLSSSIILYDYHTAEAYIKLGFNNSRIFVAPNSIDQSAISMSKKYWSQCESKLQSFQKENKIDTEATIVYIGRVYFENRLDTLIRALSRMKCNFPSIKLIVIGAGDIEIAKLKSLSERIGVSENILWAGAIYNEQDIAKWMLSSTIFCYPENIGLSIMHAFGYGLPVIASDNIKSHNPEIHSLKPNINGLLYENNSLDSLVSTLTKVLSDKIHCKVLSKNALETVEQEFNINQMVFGFKQAIHYPYFKKNEQ